MNLFATVLTHPAPTANYRGESELNRAVIQKITDGRFEYPIISPEAIRNALRDTLARYGLPMNRERLHDEGQLTVRFRDYPDPNTYADDYLFGYLIAATGKQREEILKAVGREDFRFKRDSVLRMNLAVALEPYRHDAVFTQSPRASDDSAYRNASNSALLHREVAFTAFQYPFALCGDDCRDKPEWVRALLKAIGELGGVAGNHARSLYEMAPASITVRLTNQLVAGYDTYHFRIVGRGPNNERHIGSTLIDALLDPEMDMPASEFFVGGEIVRAMSPEIKETLSGRGVTLDPDPRRLLSRVADVLLTSDTPAGSQV